MPIVPNKGDVTMKWMVTQWPAIIDWSTNSFMQWMENQTNVHLEFEAISQEGKREKVSLVLASKDYPDVFFGLQFSNEQIQQYGVAEGMLMPLEDLIDANCVEIQKIWDNFQGSRKQITQLDGHIYSMPNVNECYHCTISHKMWMNQDWLDKLGLKQPTTTDELYDVLIAFRDNDPNGNGLADEIPMAGVHGTGGWYGSYDQYLLNAFLFYNSDVTVSGGAGLGFYLDDSKNVTVPFYNAGPMKEGLKYLNKLYSEGLYYEGAFSLNGDQLTQIVENPDAALVGCFFGGYAGMHSTVGGERYHSMHAVLPLKGPSGYQGTVHDPYGAVWANNLLLSKDCKYPEIAIKWGDYMYTFDATIRSYLGVEGVGWRLPNPGEIGINGKPALYTQLIPWNEWEPQNDHICQMCIDYRPVDYRLGMAYDESTDMYSADGLEKLLQVVSEDYMQFAKTANTMPPVKFTKEENDEMMLARTELANTLKEYLTGFMKGDRDIDAEYDAFVGILKSQGMDDLIARYQKAYEVQFK